MTPGDFARVFAGRLGSDFWAVHSIERSLREGGHVPVKGRGRGSIRVDIDMAATILVAICASATGLTYPEAAEVAGNRNLPWHANMVRSLVEGREFFFQQCAGDLTKTVCIPAQTVASIRDELQSWPARKK